MSHFSVAVFTDEDTSVDGLLAPFYEYLEVEKYVAKTKQEIIQEGKVRLKYLRKTYKEYMKDKKAYRRKYRKNIKKLRFIKNIPSMLKWNNEKIYKYETRFYDEDEFTEDGGIYSTYNPKAKWDYYGIGGRWEKMLIVGNGLHVNSAKVKDIRWDLMEEENKSKLKPFDKFLKDTYYSDEYIKKRYPTEEDYIKTFTKFSTYAALMPDGTWIEPGKMGWWGLSSATAKEETEFEKNYEENILKKVEPEWQLTIVDCHI